MLEYIYISVHYLNLNVRACVGSQNVETFVVFGNRNKL